MDYERTISGEAILDWTEVASLDKRRLLVFLGVAVVAVVVVVWVAKDAEAVAGICTAERLGKTFRLANTERAVRMA